MSYKYSVVVNALVSNEKNEILVIQRSFKEEHGPGTWSVPGGKLEFTGIVHNALQKTAIKEALEETGVEIEEKMELIANNTFQHDEDGLLVIAIVFFCRYKSGNAKPSEEASDVKWIKEEEIDNFNFHNINVKEYIIKGFSLMKNILKNVR
jgi:8-oxo-dGTP diphosphatase